MRSLVRVCIRKRFNIMWHYRTKNFTLFVCRASAKSWTLSFPVPSLASLQPSSRVSICIETMYIRIVTEKIEEIPYVAFDHILQTFGRFTSKFISVQINFHEGLFRKQEYRYEDSVKRDIHWVVFQNIGHILTSIVCHIVSGEIERLDTLYGEI